MAVDQVHCAVPSHQPGSGHQQMIEVSPGKRLQPCVGTWVGHQRHGEHRDRLTHHRRLERHRPRRHPLDDEVGCLEPAERRIHRPGGIAASIIEIQDRPPDLPDPDLRVVRCHRPVVGGLRLGDPLIPRALGDGDIGHRSTQVFQGLHQPGNVGSRPADRVRHLLAETVEGLCPRTFPGHPGSGG
jgi:hypothetical protein